MKNLSVLVVVLSLMTSCMSTSAQTNDNRNLAGTGITFTPYMGAGLYFDEPSSFWPDNEPSIFTRLFYARRLNETLRLGIYLEHGKNRFSDNNRDEVYSFRRNVIGIDWLAKYPATKLHMQAGGYFGAGLIKADNWDNLKGIDFGLLAGPAFESGHIGVAVQVKAGFAPFFADGVPNTVLMHTPGVLFRVYGIF